MPTFHARQRELRVDSVPSGQPDAIQTRKAAQLVAERSVADPADPRPQPVVPADGSAGVGATHHFAIRDAWKSPAMAVCAAPRTPAPSAFGNWETVRFRVASGRARP